MVDLFVNVHYRVPRNLLYYNPLVEAHINSVRQAYIERIGAECLGMDVPFFLEPLVYDEAIGDEKGLAFASKKPETAHGTPKFTPWWDVYGGKDNIEVMARSGH